MTTFKDVAESWIASREHGSGSLGRIQFWIEQLGHLSINGISDDQIDDAISALAARGKLTGGISGAGRPSGSTNKSSPEQSQRLSELAKTYTEEALQTLVDVAKSGRTDAARVSAANTLLDRAYAKPAAREESKIVDLPPVVIQLTSPT